GLDLADQLLHPGLDLPQRLALGADLRAHPKGVEIVAQRLAHATLDPPSLAIGGGLAGRCLRGDSAMAIDLVLLCRSGREALAMRGAALHAVVERQGLAKLRPRGLEVVLRARCVLTVRELAGADLRLDLVLVEDALLLVALGHAYGLEVGMRLALVAEPAVAAAVEGADARVGLGPLAGGGDIGCSERRERRTRVLGQRLER